MGVIADSLVAYAQPLINQTDGSMEQMEKAFAITQLCYNLALTPEDKRTASYRQIQSGLKMNDQEFEEFLRGVVFPMLDRHKAMFPRMHLQRARSPWQNEPPSTLDPRTEAPSEPYPGTDRYAPCPCNSGQKYKFCCGKKDRY